VGLLIGAALAVGALAVSPAFAQDPPAAVETVHRSEADALRATLRRERVKHRADVRRAFERGRRSITVRTDVQHIIRVAAIQFGVPVDRALMRGKCESTFNPEARNGRYVGVFQVSTAPGEWWSKSGAHFVRAGIPPTDALANVLATMGHVSRHGWGQWQCGGWSHR